MRVLQLLLHDGMGGMETLAHSLDGHLTERGLTVSTAALDPLLHRGEATSPPRRVARVRALVRETDPDVVLAHSAIPNAYARIGARRGLPVVTVLHSPDDWHDDRLRRAERVLALRTAAVVAVSRTQLAGYAARFPREHAPRLVIPNGVEAPTTVPDRPVGTVPTLLFACRLVPTKQPDVLLEAAARLLADGRTFRLLMAGEGPDPSFTAALHDHTARDPALAAAVSWLGRRDDVGELMQTADLMVHPSLMEADGVAIKEAAVRALPIVLSDAVAADVDDDVVLRTFAAGSAGSLARSLGDALDDVAALQDAAGTARPALAARFSITATANCYLRLLQQVQARARGLAPR